MQPQLELQCRTLSPAQFKKAGLPRPSAVGEPLPRRLSSILPCFSPGLEGSGDLPGVSVRDRCGDWCSDVVLLTCVGLIA